MGQEYKEEAIRVQKEEGGFFLLRTEKEERKQKVLAFLLTIFERKKEGE